MPSGPRFVKTTVCHTWSVHSAEKKDELAVSDTYYVKQLQDIHKPVWEGRGTSVSHSPKYNEYLWLYGTHALMWLGWWGLTMSAIFAKSNPKPLNLYALFYYFEKCFKYFEKPFKYLK